MKRPRILVLSPLFFFPLNSGTKIRINHIIRGLTAVGDVDLVTGGSLHDIVNLPKDPGAAPAWWQDLRSVQLVPHPDYREWKETEPATYRKRVGQRLIARKGLLYKSYPIEPMRRRITRLAPEADLIWAVHLFTAAGVAENARKMVVDFNDFESAKTGRQVNVERLPYMRWAFRREAARLARDERNAVRQFARVAVCSPTDAAFLEAEDPERVWVVPNGVDDALFDLPSRPRDPKRLVFVGTMAYEPNQDAVHLFCREILPRVRARLPDVTLDIVGLAPPPSITALHDGKGIFVHANVPAVEPFVQQAALSIVPLRIGGGTRLKILESLALGTPVVSTTVGAEGLDLRSGEHLLLADTPESFADAVVKTLSDVGYRERLAEAGRRQVRQLYPWSAIRDRVITLTEGLLAANRTRGA